MNEIDYFYSGTKKKQKNNNNKMSLIFLHCDIKFLREGTKIITQNKKIGKRRRS